MTTRTVTVLGSTGSIGVSTLDLFARSGAPVDILALTAGRNVERLAEQALAWRPRIAVIQDETLLEELRHRLAGSGIEAAAGDAAVCEAADMDAGWVMSAIVGAAGLAPCLAAARAGKRLLLANKEALVVGGALFVQAVREGGATMLPIDSEHSAIFQCLPPERERWSGFIERIVLTASGGPFRTRDPASFGDITPAQAVAHPNWVMGRKISVDSATMMNKALEVIEARWLFDLEPSRIEVVIHPQSIIHSMVVCRDASVLAQLGTPDMRVPIAYGLSFPERIESGASRLDFSTLSSLSFEPPDRARFPGLQLAYEVLAGPGGASVVLNAANEVAVESFLSGHIGFPGIHEVNLGTLEALAGRDRPPASLEELLALDARARDTARECVQRRAAGC